MSEPQESPNVSVEQDGRVLTGGPGASIEAMEQAVERPAPEQATDAKLATESKPSTKGRERFSELTNQRETARREAKEANDRALALEARLKAVEERTASSGKQESPQAHPDASRAAPSATRHKPTEAEVGTAYQTYGDYVEALSDWKDEQRQHQAERERAHSSRVEKWTAERAAAVTVYPDFDEALRSGPGADIDLSHDPETAIARVEMLMALPGGGHVIYKLAKDAAEASRLATLDDRAFGFAVARMLPQETGSRPAPRASKAPPPYQPVQAGGRTVAASAAEIAAKGGAFDEYRAKRAAERGASQPRRSPRSIRRS